jgi:uncharacterized protein YueI
MSKLIKKFENIIDKIDEAITDFTTLDVTTVTGKIDKLATAEGKFDSKSLLKEINSAGTTNQALHIVAHTHIDFDNDTVLFVKESLNEAEQKLFKLHTESVENAKNSRQEMIKFMSDIIRGK